MLQPLIQTLTTRADAERERWALWLPVGVAVGIAVYLAVPVEPAFWPTLMIVPTLALGAFLLRGRPLAFGALAALLAVALGFALTQWRAASVAAPMLDRPLGLVRVEGRVALVERLPGGPRVTLDEVAIGGLAPGATPARVRVRLRGLDPSIGPGDRLGMRARLQPPAPPAMPGAFDFQRQAFFQRIGAVGYAIGQVERVAGPPPSRLDRFWLGLEHARQRTTQALIAALPGPAGTIAAALVTGDTSAIPPEVLDAMRVSGLAHILSVSGLHFSIVCGLIFFVTRGLLAAVEPVALARPIKKWAAAMALVGGAFYLLLSGASVPTQRSYVMAGLVLIAVMVDRTAISMRLLAIAAVVVLAIAPESLAGPSFQMSFAAVAALIAAYEVLGVRLMTWRAERGLVARVALAVGVLMLTSLIASVATAPFAAYHFNRLSTWGVLANLLAVPLTTLWIMPWVLLAGLLLPLGWHDLALLPAGWGIDAMIRIAEVAAAGPGATLLVPGMSTMTLGLITAGGLWLCLNMGTWRWVGLAPIALGVALVPLERPPDILASSDGRLMAVRAPDGRVVVSSLRGNALVLQTWTRRAGELEPTPWSGVDDVEGLRCDPQGCLYRARGQIVALVRDPAALAEDCRIATAVVSAVPTRRACRGPSVVIDRFDLWRAGAHALWLTPARIEVVSVAAERGRRPWAPPPRPRRSRDDDRADAAD
jgi:competence protein ComEC